MVCEMEKKQHSTVACLEQLNTLGHSCYQKRSTQVSRYLFHFDPENVVVAERSGLRCFDEANPRT